MVYLFSDWCKWRLVDIFLSNLSASPCFLPPLSLFLGLGTHGSFQRGEMSEFVVGMGKINNRVGLFGSRGPVLLGVVWGKREPTNFFFNQGPTSLKIFIHYFSLSASKIYVGIEELTSYTAGKINPLRLRCSLFNEKQQRIQACFPSKDTFKSVLKNYTDASQNSQQFLKQVDITSYSQNHNNLVVLPGSNILHLFSI